MSGCILAKLCLGLSVITTIIYTICYASPYWIQKDFSLGVPGYILGLPPPLNVSVIPISVKSHMGLLTSCDDVSINIPGFPPKLKSDCGPEGAEDWQYVAGVFGSVGLGTAVISIALSAAVVFLERRSFYNRFRVGAVIMYLLTCGVIMVPIILYATKKEFQVKPPLPNMVDYDLYWATWVAIGCDAAFGLLTILHFVQIFTSPASKEISSSFGMDNKGASY